jgi:Family of unknown function (DUF6011)
MFTSIETARAFALAGNAILTISSLRTGAHYTYRVKQAKDSETSQPKPGTYFVSLLNGPDNENDYAYLGMVQNGRFTLTKASKGGARSPSVVAFEFFMRTPTLHPQMEIRHEGRCGRCGRTLTVPSSVDAGIGPECLKMMS